MALTRRAFLDQTLRTACVASLLPHTACRSQFTPTSSTDGIERQITSFLDTRVPELLAETKVPGLSIAIVKNGALAWHGQYGTADAETDAPVVDETIFEAGSLSKPVFAYAALKLCDRGVLSLDTPLTRYSTIRPLDDPRVDAITVRRVLSHTTGLQNFRSPTEPLGFAFAPGERWRYSGEAYWYLQSVITDLLGHVDPTQCSTFESGLRICATDFSDFMQAQLLEPFGMPSSSYRWKGDYETRAAQGHDESGHVRRPRRRADGPGVARYGAVGGLHTTAVEYAKFLAEVIDPKPADEFRLGRTMHDEMLRPQIELDATSSPDLASAWALGWQILHTPSGELLNHSGDNPGFKAWVLASVPRKSGWVAFVNGDNALPIFLALLDSKTPLQGLFV